MNVEELQDRANKIRGVIIKMLMNAGSGHPAGALGSTDFFTALYFGDVLNYRADEPWWEGRDRVVLSAGHYCPVLYAVLSEADFFPKEELDTLRKIGSRLQGHPHKLSILELGMEELPGIENTSGPLGQGVSVAVGMALAAKLDKKDWRVICFMSDGEQNEGQVWEAYMTASKFSLGNLTLVIDRNNIQIDGRTEDVMPLEPFKAKLESFGLRAIEVNGHDVREVLEALKMARVMLDKPTAIILNTIPGKGVKFMENLPEWHGKSPSQEEAIVALEEINKVRADK